MSASCVSLSMDGDEAVEAPNGHANRNVRTMEQGHTWSSVYQPPSGSGSTSITDTR